MALQPPRGHNNMIFSFSWLQFPCGCHPLGHSIWPGGMRVSDPPPHRRWRRVLDSKSKSWPRIFQAQDAQLQKPRPRSPDYPLSISPPGHAHSAGPGQKSGKVCFFRFFRRSFGLPQRTSKFASKNHRKKCENHGFWPPKTVPKSIQNASENDVPTNM